MTGDQDTATDARTEALEDLASTAGELYIAMVLTMMTVGTTGFGFIGYLEHPDPMWLIYPLVPTAMLVVGYALTAVGDFLSWCLRIVGWVGRRVQARNQSATDEDMDSDQINLSEQEESA